MEAIVDDSIDEASSDVSIETSDVRTVHVFIEHAIGSVERPMSDGQLKAKFVDQSAPIIGQEQAEKAYALSMQLASSADLKELLAAATPA